MLPTHPSTQPAGPHRCRTERRRKTKHRTDRCGERGTPCTHWDTHPTPQQRWNPGMKKGKLGIRSDRECGTHMTLTKPVHPPPQGQTPVTKAPARYPVERDLTAGPRPSEPAKAMVGKQIRAARRRSAPAILKGTRNTAPQATLTQSPASRRMHPARQPALYRSRRKNYNNSSRRMQNDGTADHACTFFFAKGRSSTQTLKHPPRPLRQKTPDDTPNRTTEQVPEKPTSHTINSIENTAKSMPQNLD